jgi:hypothetical protein
VVDVDHESALPIGRTGHRALAMLPPHVQETVKAALLAGHHGSAAERARREQTMARVPLAPPYLFIVRAGYSPTFTSLRELSWVCPDLLGVVFDRRWRGQRRTRHDRVSLDRRREERRRLQPNWTRGGFILTSPGREPAPAAAPRPDGTAAKLSGTSAPAGLGTKVTPAAPAVTPPPARVADRLDARRPRRTALVVSIALLLAAASAAAFYLGWMDAPLTGPGVIGARPPAPARRTPPTTPVRPKAPAGPARTAPPGEAGVPPRGPVQAPAARTAVLPDGTSAEVTATAGAPAERSAGLAIEDCVAPREPTVAVRDNEILGALVNVRVDRGAQPPRCLYVVERFDGRLWVVDSARVEARPR